MASITGSKLQQRLIKLPRLAVLAFRKLNHNDPLRMAGATAFFTSFGLPFILIILSQGLRLLYSEDTIRHQLFQNLSGIIGQQSMRQVVNTLLAFRHLASNGLVTVLGSAFLLMVSTTLLMVVKKSINQLWRIRVVSGRHWWQTLAVRFQSLIIILATGILFSFSIVAEAAKAHLSPLIIERFPNLGPYFLGIITYGVSVVFVTLWFGVIFRFLPDARPPWKVVFAGSFFTAILFTIGKYILRLLLVYSNLSTLYGASASAVLILLFVFYTSLIMYFGVCFTRVWAEQFHQPIIPLAYATRYRLTEVDEEH